MKAVKKVLSVEALASFTSENTEAWYATADTSRNEKLLLDVRQSVDSLSSGALPLQSSYKLYADGMAETLCKVLVAHNVDKKTIVNIRGMVKMATIEVLQLRVEVIATQARLDKATTKAQKASATTAVTKATEANAKRAPSLEKARKAGRRVVDRKTTNIPGFAKQTAKNAAKQKARKAKPSKSELKQAHDKRVADKELILQALDHAQHVATDTDATPKVVLAALMAVAHVADSIVSYLPADMRTL